MNIHFALRKFRSLAWPAFLFLALALIVVQAKDFSSGAHDAGADKKPDTPARKSAPEFPLIANGSGASARGAASALPPDGWNKGRHPFKSLGELAPLLE